MKPTLLLALFFMIAFMPSPCVSAADFSFSGNVSSFVTHGFVALGTFKPDFDVYSYAFVYGDSAGNILGDTGYSRAIADGNFRPIATSFWSGTSILGDGSTNGIEGQHLWIFVFDDNNPDRADLLALCSGSNSSWFAPADNGVDNLLTNSADQFYFGSGGHGQAISLQIAPFPEPSTLALLSLPVLLSFLRRSRPASAQGFGS